MKKLFFSFLLCMCAMCVGAQQDDARWFRRITYNDGLSDNKVNCVLKSRDGCLWIGTLQGLNRYDGFRVRSFYNKPGQDTSLPDNTILALCEAADGNIWVKTAWGLCIFDPVFDRADRDLAHWMSRHGMAGTPLCVAADSRHNLWIASSAGKLYYYDFTSSKPCTLSLAKGIDTHRVSSMAAHGKDVFLVLADGTVATASPDTKRAVVADRQLARRMSQQRTSLSAYADSKGGLWVWTSSFAGRYSGHAWQQLNGYIVSGVAESRDGRFLIATDHGGLLVADASCNILRRIVNDPADSRSLPDNTLQCVYVDDMGLTWIGMYRMGLASFYNGQNHFPLWPCGDVCTMTQARDGSVWVGTNDAGIWRNTSGGMSATDNGPAAMGKGAAAVHSGLGSDVVVSSLAASDGSLWFGSFQGGLARIKDGKTTVYRKQKGALADDNVWALAQLPGGDIAVGTLGGGLQIYNHRTGQFAAAAQQCPSKYIASLAVLKDKWLAIGHSCGLSLMRLSDGRLTNIGTERRSDGTRLTSMFVIQVYADTRGLLWIATGAGLNVYDIAADRLFTVDLGGTRKQAEVNAVCEDRRGDMWLTTGNKLKRVSVRRDGSAWRFFTNTYGSAEGMQARLFNKRSMLCLHDGRVLVGGIDGVNVINPTAVRRQPSTGRVVFSGLSLYDRPVGVGDTINGHVLLRQELNTMRRLTLGHDENTFTIQLASTVPGLPETPRFMYRLRGQNKRWLLTPASDPSVLFSNLSAGHYTLEVKTVDDNGRAGSDIAVLDIVVRPPFYLSVWAWLVYMAVAAGIVCYAVWQVRKNHRDAMEKLALRKEKELEEAKLVFFTNISHELRTPLTLVISPLESLVRQTADSELLAKLRLMLRNARRLLSLTNQLLDMRRIMQGKETLHLHRTDLVAAVRECCDQFAALSDRGITLTFRAGQEQVAATTDRDKVQKMVVNLLSNAYKFTPDGGRVDVSVSPLPGDGSVHISVADNGPGVSDDDKRHLFERFYQSKDNRRGGGSGIGLNLVWEYARMHGGSVAVADNMGGGTVFTIALPLKEGGAERAYATEGDGYVTSFAPANEESSHTAPDGTAADAPDDDKKIKRTLLIVDDNDDFLTFLSSELSPHYNIRTAHDGSEALADIRRSRPDLVLTDIMMPVMDGNTLCRRIKGDDKLGHMPVVMLTARLSDENEMESRECGADDYVKKPFSLPLLRMRIDALLSRQRLDADGKVDLHISQPKITSEDEKLVAKATRYVEQHLADTDLSVEQMAADMGMSRVQLYRRLVSVTGKTPSEFIRLIRLRHAERLLAESQLNISEIAYKVGFASQRYFSRCYKDLFGYLPSEYKRGKGGE